MTAAIEVASKAAVKIVVNAVSGGSSGGGVTAHGSLTGLTTGDDHTQYQRSESVFTAAASYTITSETTIVSTGSTVVLPSAQAKAGRSVLVGAGANLTVNTSGTDTFIDGSGATTFAIQSGNGVGFTAINVTGVGWGWAIVTRQGSSYDLPVWVGQSLAAGKVLRIDGTGAPAWASIAAGDLPAATTSAAGSMSAADKTKLDGVATGATANSSDATLLARANHTGTQAAGTITGLATIATSGSATDLSTGTVPSARLSTKAVGGQGAGSTVTEPTTATSLLTSTVTIPACAAGDTLIIDAGINFTQSATSKTYTFAIKLGATTMLSVQPTVSLSATARVAHIHAVVRVLTTTSQAGAMTIVFNTNTSAATAIPYAATGTATETISSGSLALDILATTSASGSTQTLNLAFLSVNKVAA